MWEKSKLLPSSKKALSEIISYAILIVIALSMAAMVYAYLKIYIPKDKLECSEDINLIVQYVNCSISRQELNLDLTNKGLFKVSGAYVRLGNSTTKIRPQINENFTYFITPPQNESNLNPGATYSANYSLASKNIKSGENILEVQPFVLKSNRIILCERAFVAQPITCA